MIVPPPGPASLRASGEPVVGDQPVRPAQVPAPDVAGRSRANRLPRLHSRLGSSPGEFRRIRKDLCNRLRTLVDPTLCNAARGVRQQDRLHACGWPPEGSGTVKTTRTNLDGVPRGRWRERERDRENRANEPSLGARREDPRPKTARTNLGSGRVQDTRTPKRRERTHRWALWVRLASDSPRECTSSPAREKNGANEPNVSLVRLVKI